MFGKRKWARLRPACAAHGLKLCLVGGAGAGGFTSGGGGAGGRSDRVGRGVGLGRLAQPADVAAQRSGGDDARHKGDGKCGQGFQGGLGVNHGSFFQVAGVAVCWCAGRNSFLRHAKVGPQLAFQLGLQPFGADDVDVGNPVPHDGQDLVGVGDGAGHDEAAVRQRFLDLLAADEFAPLKVARCGLRHFEHHFGLVQVQPDAVFLVQLFHHGRVGGEGVWRHQQPADLAEGIGLELACVHGRQVPDAVLVYQPVGLRAFHHLGAFGFAVFEADGAGLLNGIFELLEQGFLAIQLFVVVAPHQQGVLDAAVQDVTQELGAQPGVQALQPSQAGEALHVGHAQGAQAQAVDGVAAVLLFQLQEGKALVQVALNGAQGDAKLFHQGRWVQLFAFIQATQNLCQPQGNRIVAGSLWGHVVHGWWYVGSANWWFAVCQPS